MLALEIEFLTGRYYATSFRSRDEGEWPPHPSRVFSALVAAHWEGETTAEEREALLWIEQQGAPSIAASEAHTRDPVQHFVPVNDSPLPPERRSRQPRHFPAIIPQNPTVYFIWPAAEAPPETRHALSALAARVTYLGHSASLVRIAWLDDAPSPTLVPTEGGALRLRVARRGRFAALEQDFQRERRPSAGSFACYAKAANAAELVSETVFGEMLIFRCVEGPIVPVTATINLTSIVRDAVLERAGENAPALLHGHGEHPHVAYVPLPFVGSQYADGHLMGFAAVLPRGISRADRRAVLGALGNVRELTLGKLGEWKIEQVAASNGAVSLDADTWCEPSRIWATVTPIVFDRFPRDRTGDEAVEIISKSCERIGLAPPIEVHLLNASKFSGVPLSRQFRIRRRDTDPPKPATHAVLLFDQEVAGPVILGASRYFGLGLCRPWEGARFR